MIKNILVTGASKGIGKDIAMHLACDQCRIFLHYNSDENGAQEAVLDIRERGFEAYLIQFDVNDRESVAAKLSNLQSEWGAFYGVILNAGIVKDAPFVGLSDSDWDSVINTNLGSFYNVLKPILMKMIRAKSGGRIIVISSVSGVMGNRGQVNYSASKAGLIGAMKSLAVELASRRITVNCVAPGLINTGIVDEEVLSRALPMIPMGRIGEVNEVSGIVDFLMSDKSSYITRQVISVNGGMF